MVPWRFLASETMKPATALAAEHRALEVVVMVPLLLASGVLGVEHGLDLVPYLGADERLVQRPVAYCTNAHAISGPRSGSTSMTRASRPFTMVQTLRYPIGALPGVPPSSAFLVLPLTTSAARLRE